MLCYWCRSRTPHHTSGTYIILPGTYICVGLSIQPPREENFDIFSYQYKERRHTQPQSSTRWCWLVKGLVEIYNFPVSGTRVAPRFLSAHNARCRGNKLGKITRWGGVRYLACWHLVIISLAIRQSMCSMTFSIDHSSLFPERRKPPKQKETHAPQVYLPSVLWYPLLYIYLVYRI